MAQNARLELQVTLGEAAVRRHLVPEAGGGEWRDEDILGGPGVSKWCSKTVSTFWEGMFFRIYLLRSCHRDQLLWSCREH